MDKINRALIGAEDNAHAIRALAARLESVRPPTDGACKFVVASGTVKTVSGGSVTSFGRFKVNAPTAVIAVGRTGTYVLTFCGNPVATGYGTVVGVLGAGEGELRFTSGATSSNVLLVGDAEKADA